MLYRIPQPQHKLAFTKLPFELNNRKICFSPEALGRKLKLYKLKLDREGRRRKMEVGGWGDFREGF